MKITPAIIQREFIGLDAEVVNSPQSSYVGIKGRVVDETRNTLVILQKEEKKIVVKETAVFHFTIPDGTVLEIDGKTIVGKPEDRIKKRITRRW